MVFSEDFSLIVSGQVRQLHPAVRLAATYISSASIGVEETGPAKSLEFNKDLHYSRWQPPADLSDIGPEATVRAALAMAGISPAEVAKACSSRCVGPRSLRRSKRAASKRAASR
eukprot:gnl/TRDRNA2_/TRDRNA2_143873_c1_seq1.p1 gnl/TRDRNA2_/TRDRNA2_143873_c1~~gnl/TRDRNA2_/TRDRNA2_143873_c1_seq1.p1  ORF type:complete len:114 (-),score=24.00 gnl/TRDRNA2_/TRDRNA2_143873_c1_seq1:217-558(-)